MYTDGRRPNMERLRWGTRFLISTGFGFGVSSRSYSTSVLHRGQAALCSKH